MKHVSIFLLLALAGLLARCQSSAARETSLQEIADGINKKCPQMVDSETRLDGIEIKDQNSKVVYKYTLVNLLAEQVDTFEFRRALWPGLLGHIKTSPAMKPLRDQKTNFEYYYQDKQGHFIYSLPVAPADYIP